MKRSPRERDDYSSLLSEEFFVKENSLRERNRRQKKDRTPCVCFPVSTNKTLIKTLLITANETPSESEKV